MPKFKPFVKELFGSTITSGLEVLDKEAEAYIPPEIIEVIEAAPISEEFKKAILPLTSKGVESPLGVLAIMLLGMALGAAVGVATPIARAASMKLDRLIQTYRLDPSTITRLWLRGFPDEARKEEWWDDLREQGWSPEKIEAAKELAKAIPPLSDMVRFADFSAFDPEVIEKWREFYDAPEWLLKPFELLGITNEAPRDWANKYWFSHYVQPGRFELGELFKRSKGWEINPTPENLEKTEELGVVEDDLTLAYRTMAYSEFWQKRLVELAKEIPTRVDIRRWWDMRTIDEDRLRQLYQAQGYFGDDLEDYVLWTKVYTAFPDLVARVKYGWITEETAKGELLAMGMPPDRAEEMWQTKFKKVVAPERVQVERDLTKTDITMAVKKEIMSRGQGVELLVDLGYSQDEAGYIIDARVAAAGSPESYFEFKKLVGDYRKALGEPVKEIPAEVLEAEKLLRGLEVSLKEKTEAKAPQEELDIMQADIATARARLDDLKALHEL